MYGNIFGNLGVQKRDYLHENVVKLRNALCNKANKVPSHFTPIFLLDFTVDVTVIKSQPMIETIQ